MELALAALKDQRSNSSWVIPPHFLGHGAIELEGRDHPREDRLGALKRQRQHKGSVGVGPGGDEEGDQPAALGEVDVDVTEIGFQASARQVRQRDERLLMTPAMPAHVALHLGVSAAVSVLGAEAAKHLSGGVPLLGRGRLVGEEDLVDDRLDRP